MERIGLIAAVSVSILLFIEKICLLMGIYNPIVMLFCVPITIIMANGFVVDHFKLSILRILKQNKCSQKERSKYAQ